MVERLVRNEEVRGSNPLTSTSSLKLFRRGDNLTPARTCNLVNSTASSAATGMSAIATQPVTIPRLDASLRPQDYPAALRQRLGRPLFIPLGRLFAANARVGVLVNAKGCNPGDSVKDRSARWRRLGESPW